MKVYHLNFTESFIRPVLDNGVSKVVQFSFSKGKVLEKHKTSSDILVFVLQGKIRFKANEEVILQSGDMVSLEKHVEHSIEAIEESLVVLVLTPSPVSNQEIGSEPRKSVENSSNAKAAVSPQLWSFVEEHAELLEVLDRTAGGYHAETYDLADKMVHEELNKHFRYEEEILFPLLGKYIGTNAGPIAVMLSEHKIIRDNHETFRKRLQDLKNHKGSELDVVQAFKPLESVLRAHIMKEDNVLFPMASSVMSEEDKNEVARKVNEEKQL
jgi:hemerythrin-like domain-containing protein/quercetin dioxygenase-like cupin family protein